MDETKIEGVATDTTAPAVILHEPEPEEAPLSLVRLGGEELDIQIVTAKRYPRSLKQFQQEAMSMATIDEETAASCFYVLPRAGKKIEGPGVRLAEIVANCWRNLKYGSKVVGETEDRKFVIAEGFAWDLEKNVASAIRVQRRITDKHGKRYNDDMIGTTSNAAASIALRNAIFKVIPMLFVQQIYLAAKKLAIGDAVSLKDRREKMLAYFAKFGVEEARILAKVKKPSIEDIDLTDLELLVGLSTAIKDGDVDVDAAFPAVVADEDKPKTLAEKVKKAKEKVKERQPGEDG
jgi:hypothetical protein